MRAPAVAVVAFVAGMLLAVALSSRAPPPEEVPAADAVLLAADGPPAIPRPTWAVGDAWRAGFGDLDPLCWVVVVYAGGDGYRQGFWCPEDAEGLDTVLAVQAAVFDSPVVGYFGPDLSGRSARAAETVAWYDWPLFDGKAWTTEDEGGTIEVVAHWDGDRYVMIATREGEAYATWDYVPALRWWSHLTYASGYEVLVEEREARWTRGAVSANATLRLHDAQEGAALYGVPHSFSASEEDEVLAVLLQRDGGPYAERVELRDPQMRSAYQATAQNVLGGTGVDLWLVAGEPGTWTVVRAGATGGDASLDVLGVAFSRLPGGDGA